VAQKTYWAVLLLGRIQVFASDIDPPCQAGMNGEHMRRTFLPRGQCREFDLWMIHNDPNQFERRVTRCSEDANIDIVEIVSLRISSGTYSCGHCAHEKVHSALRNVTVNFHSRSSI